MRTYLVIIIGLLAMCIFFGIAWQSEKKCRVDKEKEIIALSGQKTALEKEIEKRNKNAIELQKRNEELEALAKQDDFNWNADVSNTFVILRLKDKIH